jgi:hypothetical protein
MNKNDLETLTDAIHYMNMAELKAACARLGLSASGMKGNIIHRILHFAASGEALAPKHIPEASKAKRGQPQLFRPGSLILSGNYKNDEATRAFLKRLIGPHFHFTSFGQDFIKTRWMQGKPPTFREFADYWQRENEARKSKKASPKREWALLNFRQQYLAKNPNATNKEITAAWAKTRKEKLGVAAALLKKLKARTIAT